MHADNNEQQTKQQIIGYSMKINPNLMSFNCFLRLILIINNNYENCIRSDSKLHTILTRCKSAQDRQKRL